jgi:c-di-GMP-binding flagellar brake protein YcgR
MSGDVSQTRLVDVSTGGARFRHEGVLEVGSVHDFAFDLLGETIRVRARVRHCLPEERGNGYEVGVQFVAVEPKIAQRIREYACTGRFMRRSRSSS